ncbi:hypothetical protein BQ8482_220060 [Mesorhizobium delmotii]|uniref:Uncharacterized protein n=1 Tax=Mesorhizobium delmotii TaxID=1631247 RepID=A0A2P9ALA1_9HYPH|nr:hypothetical protein BQ8482_220060 [Mesorhizobium delmotii]
MQKPRSNRKRLARPAMTALSPEASPALALGMAQKTSEACNAPESCRTASIAGLESYHGICYLPM